MKGILICSGDRPDVALYNGRLLGGLHCGDCFLCKLNGQWEKVRLELSSEWELVGSECRLPVPYGSEIIL